MVVAEEAAVVVVAGEVEKSSINLNKRTTLIANLCSKATRSEPAHLLTLSDLS